MDAFFCGVFFVVGFGICRSVNFSPKCHLNDAWIGFAGLWLFVSGSTSSSPCVCVCVRVLVSNVNAAVSYSVQLPKKNNSVVVDNDKTATKNKWQAFATVASHSLRDMHLLYLCVCFILVVSRLISIDSR